jgi:biopolymer transport protein ExbB/TolQ
MNTEFITLLIVGLIISLFFAEVFYFYPKRRSIKSTLTIVGVLGTFIGILLGLWNFDYVNVENSLPSLLGGLNTAFITSIAGMTAFFILTIIEKFRETKSTNSKNFVDILSDIHEELKNLNTRVKKTED